MLMHPQICRDSFEAKRVLETCFNHVVALYRFLPQADGTIHDDSETQPSTMSTDEWG
jgi:hypothetical protein